MYDHAYTTEQSNALADRHGLSRYYKVLSANGKSTHVHMRWPLPEGGEPGGWVGVTGRLVMCQNGIHAVRLPDIQTWMFNKSFRLYEIDLNEKGMIHCSNKVVARAGRLVRRLDFNKDWSHTSACKYWNLLDRQDTQRWVDIRTVDAAAEAVQMLVGRRKINVNGMIEQLVAEQLAA